MNTEQEQKIVPAGYVCLPQQFQPQFQEEDEIDLLALVATVWKWKWLIASFSLVCTLIAVYATLFVMPVLYTSDAALQPSGDSNNPLSKLGAVAQFLPISISSGDDKSQVMINFLNSREMKEWMIKNFDLLVRYNPEKWDSENKKWLVEGEAVPTVTKMLQSNALKGNYSVDSTSDSGLLNISFTDEDPAFAASVVNGVISELDRFLREDYVTDAKRNRLFVEDQLQEAQANLEYWEKQVPTQNMTANQIQRELLAATTVYTELKKQFELAKIEEDKQLVAFKVLDQPLVPEIRSSPERSKICAITLVATGFVALFGILILEFIASAIRNSRLVLLS